VVRCEKGWYCSDGDVDVQRRTFTFLNRRLHLGEPIDWFPEEVSQLWIYNLHYFEYVVTLGRDYALTGNGRAYQGFRRLVTEWIDQCPVATPLAWDPYPLSLRMTNWFKAYTLFEPALRGDETFAVELCQSLYAQASFLEDNIEYHLLGNHLVENGRALLMAGLFFTDENAQRWQRKGKQILWRELSRQFLNDGGHYERSPMYHQKMLELYKEVVSVLGSGQAVPERGKRQIRAMEKWLRSVLHPDGGIPLLNDATLEMAGDPADLLAVGEATSQGLLTFPDSGYFVFRNSLKQDFMVFDCGALGPDHQPGHGHCDALSYELSLSGQRIVVDSGVGNYYGEFDWRHYYRSTRAHNTVVVDEEEQSEIWDRFRVARRAYPLDVQWADESPALAYVAGSHTGYRRLKGRVTHRRWVCWVDGRFWVVCDRITGDGHHRVESLIHFHPQVRIISDAVTTDAAGRVRCNDVNLKVLPWGIQKVATYFGETSPIQGWYAPEFGLRVKNHVWGFRREDELPFWLGYVLWPELTEVSIRISVVGEHSCRVDVGSEGKRYRIVFGSGEVRFYED
jgi:uncharacterized heparinase superfamily protein